MTNRFLLACLVAATMVTSISADDWPMWRANAGRTGVTKTALPESLEIKWSRDLLPTLPAFHNERLQFDAGYEPIVAKGHLLIASSRTDSITAFDTDTGEESWSFRTNGPIRLAPAVWDESVCFGSDDGHLYCVDIHSGKLNWQLRAVPSDRRVLGNRRLISTWPLRGGAVVADGRVYFAAGVWPFEGVFVYAVDVATGDVIWRNDRLGYLFGTQPHNTQAIGGLAPQGYLVINDDELIVPCSTAYPARLNRSTGKLIEFELPAPGRLPGGWFAAIDPEKAKAIRRGQLTFDDVINRQQHEDKVYKGRGQSGVSRKIVASGRTLSFDDRIEGVDGTIHSIVPAGKHVFISTREGRIYCLGDTTPARRQTAKHWPVPNATLETTPDAEGQSRDLIAQASTRHGVALVIGLENGELAKALLATSDYHVVAIENDLNVVELLRTELIDAGLYGTRCAVVHGNPKTIDLPPYIATVLATETPGALDGCRERFLECLRPFGGVARLGFSAGSFDTDKLPEGTFEHAPFDNTLIVKRIGALPGATDYFGDWEASPDELVRFPLGVLWFDDTVAHFKRSPQPTFVDGVMVSKPKDWHAPRRKEDNSVDYPLLPAVLSDIYTGRVFDSTEQLQLRAALSESDPEKREPSQYRPPHQKNAWKPDQPLAGTRTNPLTGQEEPRTFPKTYGCDGGVDYGSFYTVRSGTPAFYDKTLESGTVFLSGPRSGCTNSIIPSGGLLNVPYFYEGCTCSYPLPTAMSLVSMPESHEQWSSWGSSKLAAKSVKRVGLNFGAPGDRMTRSGTLWLDYPSVGGPSPEIKVSHSPAEATFRYHHSLWINGGEGHRWVAASAVEGLTELTVSDLKSGDYLVRLVFSEPDDVKVGTRVQNVTIQKKTVLDHFDIAATAGGTKRSTIQEFNGISVDHSLTLNLSPVKGKTLLSGIEILRTE